MSDYSQIKPCPLVEALSQAAYQQRLGIAARCRMDVHRRRRAIIAWRAVAQAQVVDATTAMVKGLQQELSQAAMLLSHTEAARKAGTAEQGLLKAQVCQHFVPY